MNSRSRLIPVSYYNASQEVRLSAYADTIVYEQNGPNRNILRAIRFGGYPEMVRGLSDAVYAGGTLDANTGNGPLWLESQATRYRRQVTHDGVYMRSLGSGVVQYIGIAYDEQERLTRLEAEKTISLLEKYQKTERDAADICKRAGLYSPAYAFSDRNGCFFCPNAKERELRHLYECYPDLWARLLECQGAPNKATELFNRKERFDEIDQRFRNEDAQMSLFDDRPFRAAA